MSTSNVRKLAEQKRRQAREEQRMAWARGDQRERPYSGAVDAMRNTEEQS